MYVLMPLSGVIGVVAVDPGDASQQLIGKAIWGWGPMGGAMSQPPSVGWESHWSRSLCVLFGKIRNQPGSWGLVGAYEGNSGA